MIEKGTKRWIFESNLYASFKNP